jgi:hypothetical protein
MPRVVVDRVCGYPYYFSSNHSSKELILAPGWIVGIILGYVLFNLGLWKSDSSPKPQDTLWALVMLGGTILMFVSVLLWAVPGFFDS